MAIKEAIFILENVIGSSITMRVRCLQNETVANRKAQAKTRLLLKVIDRRLTVRETISKNNILIIQ